ncbi:hypothetical protein AX15_005443 [Amanita polypyramis BW_CC]|nr:hypothetical protein AX15_005443 [Amanita polypyramis BW_CC]
MLQQCQRASSIHDLPLTDFILYYSRELEKTYVVIDALDECSSPRDLLPEHTKLAQHINILVTSRDQPSIRTKFGGYAQIVVNGNDIEDDVEQFVVTEMQHMKIEDIELRRALVKKLSSGAQGTFLWPMSYIQCMHGLRTVREIQLVQNSPPQKINEFALGALESIDALPHSDILRLALHLAMCAIRPLSLGGLPQAVATAEMGDAWDPSCVVTDPFSIVDDCAYLLMRVPPTDMAQYHDYYWQNSSSDMESWKEGILADDNFVVPFHVSVKALLLAGPETIPSSLHKYMLHPINGVHADIA